ncbi:helix-hairpin-helix domain-containing protein [Herpetosiphon sp. NSE202]|uniref:helix-hairpin-helix domain-containing protein n=1 Tax=Herpetosiphon sp. NSE202 TaxID=3351349 RepID=UPI00362FF14B
MLQQIRWQWLLGIVVAGFLGWNLWQSTASAGSEGEEALSLWPTSAPTEAPTLEPITPTLALTPTLAIAEATPTIGLLGAYISGAVAKPGVYELPLGARLDDLVQAAGGLQPDADSQALNLAAYLQDAQHVHVPIVGETPAPTSEPTPVPQAAVPAQAPTSVARQPTLININTASATELESLPKIGQAIAERIVAYREEHGAFATIEAIQEVKGIGASTFAEIESLITVE